jgi:hypothetical protein
MEIEHFLGRNSASFSWDTDALGGRSRPLASLGLNFLVHQDLDSIWTTPVVYMSYFAIRKLLHAIETSNRIANRLSEP